MTFQEALKLIDATKCDSKCVKRGTAQCKICKEAYAMLEKLCKDADLWEAFKSMDIESERNSMRG